MLTDSCIVWYQKYRPRKIEDCILPASLKETFDGVVKNGKMASYTFAGRAGVGKTTVALALAEELGCEVIVLNGSGEDRGIDSVKGKITRFATSMSLDGSHKLVILNEADNLTNDAQLALRAIIEDVSNNCSFILTANYVSRIEPAILSRCEPIEFKVNSEEVQVLQAKMFRRCLYILDTEGVAYDKAAVAQIVQRCFPDFRKTINSLQKFAQSGKIDSAIVESSAGRGMKELVDALKSKKMSAINQWVAETTHVTSEVARWMDDFGDEIFADESSWAQANVDGADHDYKEAFVSDAKLNLKALLLKMSSKCKFR